MKAEIRKDYFIHIYPESITEEIAIKSLLQKADSTPDGTVIAPVVIHTQEEPNETGSSHA